MTSHEIPPEICTFPLSLTGTLLNIVVALPLLKVNEASILEIIPFIVPWFISMMDPDWELTLIAPPWQSSPSIAELFIINRPPSI